MPYQPPPETPKARRRREEREARAAQLGCSLDALLVLERLERTQAEARELGSEEAAARLAERRDARAEALQAFVQNQMDYTLDERARVEAEAALLARAAADPAAFLAADEAELLRRVCDWV